jgi:tyrosine-protein phosphatase YwqE
MLLETIFQLEMAGFKPILAHPERYQYLKTDKGLMKDLIDSNILFQVNLLSLKGFYSKQVKDFGEMMVERDLTRFFWNRLSQRTLSGYTRNAS